MTEDGVVSRAIDMLFDLGLPDGDEGLDWSAASNDALAEVWDNSSDAISDDWRRLYGVPARWRGTPAVSLQRCALDKGLARGSPEFG